MAHSRFVNAFSRISKNYVFRFQIFCFVFVAGVVGLGVCVGGRGGHLVLYPVIMYSFRSEFKGNNGSNDAVLCL